MTATEATFWTEETAAAEQAAIESLLADVTCAGVPNARYRKFRATVYVRDQGRCRYCGVEVIVTAPDSHDLMFTIEHIWPEHRGGKTDLDNCVTCCRRCNNAKGGQTLYEWVTSGHIDGSDRG